MKRFILLIIILFGFSVAANAKQLGASIFISDDKLEQEARIIQGLIEKGSFARAEKIIVESVKNNLHNNVNIKFFNVVTHNIFGVNKFPDNLIVFINRWVDYYPESYIAHDFKGAYYLYYTKKIQDDFRHGDNQAQFEEQFFSNIEKSRSAFKAAYNLNKRNNFAPTKLMEIANIMGNKALLSKYYEIATKIDNRDIEPYKILLYSISPKWGGTQEQMLAFARKALEVTSEKTSLAQLIILAHEEIAPSYEGYYESPDIWQEINEAYQLLVQNFPQSKEFAIAHAIAARNAQKYDLFEKMMANLAAKYPDYERIYLERGIYYRDHKHKYKLAINDFEKYIAFDTENAHGYGQIAYVYVILREYKKSNEYYAQALSLDMDEELFWNMRCYNFIQGMMYDLAFGDCQKALEINPYYAPAYKNRAQIYKNMKNKEQYLADMDKYLELSDYNAWQQKQRNEELRNYIIAGSIGFLALFMCIIYIRRRR